MAASTPAPGQVGAGGSEEARHQAPLPGRQGGAADSYTHVGTVGSGRVGSDCPKAAWQDEEQNDGGRKGGRVASKGLWVSVREG